MFKIADKKMKKLQYQLVKETEREVLYARVSEGLNMTEVIRMIHTPALPVHILSYAIDRERTTTLDSEQIPKMLPLTTFYILRRKAREMKWMRK